MRIIIVSLLAASLAYVFNTIIIKKVGLSVLVDIIPIVEEVIKTYSAVRFNILIFYVHFIFGLVEAYSDYRASERIAAIMSILSHSIFGVIAYFVYINYGLLWSLTISSALHMTYNKIMLLND